HNQIVHQITGDAVLDYGMVADAGAEIKKRAGQLQTALSLPKPDDTEQSGRPVSRFGDSQMKEALVVFCKQIESFVKNPIIEHPGTVNTVQAARARRDLQDVIDLADQIRKMAERLKKVSK